jgi:hypothetical protein
MSIANRTSGNNFPVTKDPIKAWNIWVFYSNEIFDPISIVSQKTNPWLGIPRGQTGGGYKG